jgi:DNA sulfur modification protein DndB
LPFIDPAEAAVLREKLSVDPSGLGKLYKAKKSEYMVRSVDHSLVEDLIADGWEEFGKPLKTKTKLRKRKNFDKQFEDDVWCQMYDLGYRHLNIDRDFQLPFGPQSTDKKQIDVVAANDDTILIFECKSSENPKKAPSFKTEFEALKQRLDGHSKALEQIFGKGRRVKYIFATRNLRLSRDSVDIQRLEQAKGFFYNDNTYDYVDRLVKTYKNAAHYQFMGMMFKGQNINKERIEVPAIEGKMGAKTYYMFSIEPSLLLKLGFVLHRTRANESEMPTYQRLLVPSRLKGITKFIDGGGYFPNSAIVNFSEKDAKLEFQAHQRAEDTGSRTGLLKIPNAYGIAYIIDGQHRIYGYANSRFKDTNTIPVVAMVGLAASEQLELFMDINQNQKAVSPTLRITLEEDLFWNSPRLDSRMRALRSSIIRQLGGDQSGPLFGKISLGEDKAELQAKPFADALVRCGLLPEAKGNKFADGTTEGSIYDTSNTDHEAEMLYTRSRVVSFLNACYEAAEETLEKDQGTLKEFILSNRGTYAFISLLGSLHKFETNEGHLTISASMAIAGSTRCTNSHS